MGETAFTISGWFSPNLSKLPDLDETMSSQVFKIALELGPFFGALGPILRQNLALSKYGWSYGHGDLISVFLVEFYSKIRHFCKNLKIFQNW